MRLSLWLGLFFAFSVGMCCALAIRSLHFEAKPVTVRIAEPTIKILVATKTIPSGIEITADFVAFQEVAVSEVPIGALSNFRHVYRRQPAYPIPAGCPICEDLLLPYEEAALSTAFVPTGSHLVALDVVHVRQGHLVFSPQEPISTVLTADQRVDIRIVPQRETPGKLAELKNQVLQSFSRYDFRNSGDLILENVPIHKVQRRSAGQQGEYRDSLVLMLDRSETAQLAAAARQGQLRVILHQNEKPAEFPIDFGNYFEMAQQTQTPQSQTIPPTLPPLTLPSEIPPFTLEQPPSREETGLSAPMPPNIFESELPSEPLLTPVPSFAQTPDLPELGGKLPTDVNVSEKVSIRNDTPVVSFGTSTYWTTPAEQPVEQRPVEPNPILEQAVPPTGTPEIIKSGSSHLEPVLGNPRISQSIQFAAPDAVAPVRTAVRQESNMIQPAMFPSSPELLPTAAPQVISVSPIPQEKAARHDYSPFERRTSSVMSGLTAPPLLKTER